MAVQVLIVDDHPGVTAGLVGMFSTAPDLDVCGTADSGEAGLELAASLEPDVVIMDQLMPGMGGIAATRAIKSSGLACHVLMLSGHWTAGQVQAAKEAGADAIELKGGHPRELLTVIRDMTSKEQGLESDSSRPTASED